MLRPDANEILRTAHAMAEAARSAVLPFFRVENLATANKLEGGYDPVTEADKGAERAMRAVLAEMRPNDAIIGEEYGTREGHSGLTWVLDPVDGTRGFVAGTPTWGVLIALCDDSGPIFGMIDQPYIGERFWGGFGQAQMTGPQGERVLKTRASRPLEEAVLFTTFPEVGSARERAGFEAVAKHVQLTRYGMDCYAYALIAAGQIDLVVEAGLSNYDVCAPIAVIKAAGGIVTDWHGRPAHAGGQILAAANAAQHSAALEILREFA